MWRPDLTIAQILQWADNHYKATGKWPLRDSGRIPGSLGETWTAMDQALRKGGRRLPFGGSSLAQLLAERRGVRNRMRLPRFQEQQIVAWADAHHRRTGMWPNDRSGPIPEVPGDTWHVVDAALRKGCRGLPAKSSLFRLLAKHRQIGVHLRRPPFNVWKILEWADAHFARTGDWPTKQSGLIPEATGSSLRMGTSWMMVNVTLRDGKRGLPRGSSLSKLLLQHRGVRPTRRPSLRIEQIRLWAGLFRERFGRFPSAHSGRIPRSGGLTWSAIDNALRKGLRRLPGNSSLTELLQAPPRRSPRP